MKFLKLVMAPKTISARKHIFPLTYWALSHPQPSITYSLGPRQTLVLPSKQAVLGGVLASIFRYHNVVNIMIQLGALRRSHQKKRAHPLNK